MHVKNSEKGQNTPYPVSMGVKFSILSNDLNKKIHLPKK